MDYTSEQYALMERLESGLLYQNLTEKEQEILRYLDESSLTQPRAYIEDGYYELSQEVRCPPARTAFATAAVPGKSA